MIPAARLERQLRDAEPVRIAAIRVDADPRRTVHDSPIREMGELVLRRLLLRGSPQAGDHDRARLRAQVLHVELDLAVEDTVEAHAALGQSARLVRAEQVDAPESLDGSRVAHQRAAAGQAACRAQLGHGGEHGQAFGHRSHGQADARLQGLAQRDSSEQTRDRQAEPARQRHRHGDAGEVAQAGLDAGTTGLGVLDDLCPT